MGHSGATDVLGARLATQLPLLGLVLVPARRRARVLWHEGPADPAKIAALTALGREHLATGVSETAADGGAVLGMTMRAPGETPPAVVLAVQRDAQAWTRDERAVLVAALTEARDDLLTLAMRPQPGQDFAAAFERRMRTAARDDELVLLYQPEVDLRDGRILALEALLRWDHPALGRLEPHAFIPLAERSDLITLLGDWVIDHALEDFGRWHDDRITLRLNVSPAQLTSDCIVHRLTRALAENAVRGSQICVEFTETAPSSNGTEFAWILPVLAELGITTALDDLAVGYSTLSRLRSLPVDVIKIDRSLVVGIDGDDRARAIVRALLHLADDLALEVVAEGIENPREAETLRGLGCRRGQGHYFARPLAAPAVEALLRSGERLRGSDTA